MVNIANIAENSCKSCGGYGAWIGNSLGSPAPGAALWPGFQLGGGIGGRGRGRGRGVHNRRKILKSRNSRNSRKSQKPNRRRKLHTRRH